MSEFVGSPNLPQSKVTAVVVSGENEAVCRALEGLGISLFKTDPCARLAAPVASHADMLFCHLGGDRVIAERSQKKLGEQLERQGFIVSDHEIESGRYPFDAGLNVLRLNGRAVFCPKSAAERAVADLEPVPVRQGYTKCSVCVVDESSIITDDESIERACREHFDVLKIRKGFVRLPGYDYGFIGGCTGMIDKNAVAFCGSLSSHPDGNRIKAFLSERNVEAVELFEGELIDIGSILPVMTVR